ncbi:amino acid ABC transporter permease [Pajaroellobacter abortibovis]|uniref:Glutamine ABC transporter permease n=1 Tax=Pajaroellobacter abortibovis TaxID=1882918 RepID=A0A1L6MXW6_9BACT|nr:amino acid ABC transporter permease [Pajaroellobacter abortibovis]APS00360.1 glutamine ABC transporter permease [Pajaroellobacter abortibovis]
MNLLKDVVFIGQGIGMTFQLLLGGVFLGLVLGCLFAVFRFKGWMAFWIERFISIARGTPLLLQLSLFYFAIPGVLGIQLDILTAGVLTLGFNSSAYVAEILRGGIESLPKGQFEAAKTLGISSGFMWKDIILPQVLRNVFPALINELIALLKETALISTLGGMDLMRRAQSLAAEQFNYFGPLCIVGAYYYGFVVLIEFLGKRIERRWGHAKNC